MKKINFKFILLHHLTPKFIQNIIYNTPEKYWKFVYGDCNSFRENNRMKIMTEQFISEIISFNPKSVLEVGCGWGRVLNYFKDSNIKLNGVDFNHFWIKECKRNLKGNFYMVDETKGLPFPDNSFDVVYTNGNLMHIKSCDIGFVISEIKRVSSKYVMHLERVGYSNFHIFNHDYDSFYIGAFKKTIPFGNKEYRLIIWEKSKSKVEVCR